MRELKIYQLRTLHLPKWMKIRKIIWVYRQKEFYNHPALGIWWSSNRGIGIANKPKEFRHLMLGIDLIGHTTWLNITWIANINKKAKGLVTGDPESYLKNKD